MSGRIAAKWMLVLATVLPAVVAWFVRPDLHAETPAAAASTSVEAKHQAEVAEAIKRNGPMFVDWPKPRFALIFTGDLTGYIEPCGCAGLENLKGGLSRRHSLIKQLQDRGWPVAAFDLGGLVRRVGTVQTEIKLQATIKGLIAMNYAAVGFGADDLRMPAAVLLGAATEPYRDRTLPYISSNVGLFAFDSGATARYRTLTVGDIKLGVTTVLGDAYRKSITNEGIVLEPVDKALADIIPKLKADNCDGQILLCYADAEETAAIARRFPQFQYICTAGGVEEPPAAIKLIEGTQTALVEVGKKGQYASVVAFFDDEKTPVRYQRVALDARFPESSDMKQLLTEYQEQLKIAGFANLGITEKIHPRSDPANPTAGQFVGSQACAKCHQEAFDVWKNSGHAHATETLVKLTPARHFDPECLSCHVTGWDPQQYVPFQTGFLGLDAKQTPHLTGNGCENCHGPGGGHAAAEAGRDPKLQEQFRKLMHVELQHAERTICQKCHDHDNSPEFKFETYWPQIEH
jgi:hypothetical protein